MCLLRSCDKTIQRKIHPPTTHRPIQYSNIAVQQHVRQYTGTRGAVSWSVIECGGPGWETGGVWLWCTIIRYLEKRASRHPLSNHQPRPTHSIVPDTWFRRCSRAHVSCVLSYWFARCCCCALVVFFFSRGDLNSTHGTTSTPRPHHHIYAAGTHARDERMGGTRTVQPLYAYHHLKGFCLYVVRNTMSTGAFRSPLSVQYYVGRHRLTSQPPL